MRHNLSIVIDESENENSVIFHYVISFVLNYLSYVVLAILLDKMPSFA